MPNEKPPIPYAVGKGNRPKVEEVIDYCLDGDLKQSALSFAAYMREEKMPFKICTSTTRSQRAVYGGGVICNIIVFAEEDWDHVDIANQGDPAYWTVAPNLYYLDKYREAIISEKLQISFNGRIWWCTNGAHKDRKGSCNPDKPCSGGRDLTIFGDGYDGICMWGWPAIKNPNEATIEKIKRLLDLERTARDDASKTEK